VEEIYTGPTRKALRKAGGPQAKAEAVWSRLVQPFVERHPDQPFFLYLHEIDPHGPYQPLPPYDSMYDFGYAGRLSSHSQVLRAINSGDVPLDDIDLRYLLSQYDGEISFMDAYLGWILDHLSETGLAKNTLVVLLSDHGEEFMEHGHLTHMTTVYDEVLRVPLIFSLPGVLPQGRRVEGTAELTDVAPTVLDLLGIDTPASFQGRSLLGAMTDADAADSSRPAFAMVSVGPWRRDSVRLGGYKLLREERVGSAQPPDHQLFDIRRDPGETIDLWSREPVVGGALAHLLRAHRAAAEAAPVDSPSQITLDELDPKIRENMRMLGYIE
jgi:arylsulfatase A-like enzyme